jgi:hypothetical protein
MINYTQIHTKNHKGKKKIYIGFPHVFLYSNRKDKKPRKNQNQKRRNNPQLKPPYSALKNARAYALYI